VNDISAVVLKRYLEIRNGHSLPYFALLKKIKCKRCTGLEEMWKEHARAMEDFREEKKNNFQNIETKPDTVYSLLDLKYDIAKELLKGCVFCERRCRANRAEGKIGWCRVGAEARIATMFEHWGEERVLVPSGTIFFSGCTWRCVYCQNWDISQFPERGAIMSGKEIASWIDEEAEGGRIINANFVGGEPTPNLHTIIDTARHTKSPTPIIWNFILFRYVLGIPKGAQNKKFPDLIFNVDNNLRKEFLSAYITGDGTLAYRPAKSCCFVRVVTTSNMIKTQMAYLLSSEGIKFSIHKHICTSVLPTGYRSKLLQWWIAFGGKKNIQKFVQVASFLDPRMNRLYNFLKRTKELRKKEEYEAIRELRQVRPTRNFVYDIVLEGGDNDWRKHSFYAGDGILIHNCQNWDISQFPERGAIMSGKEIASWIDEEAEEGRVINANFVGGEPTPNLHTIIDTARHTKSPTPIIWNSNMYMSEETNDLLEGVVDLYLADFRYGNDECAMRLSSVPNYMATMKRNFKRTSRDAEMIVRILVLPNHIECCARNILKWIGENIADRVYVNLMSQYRPEYKAMEYPEIARRLYSEEYRRAVKYLKETGIKYFEIQGGI